MSKKWLHGMAMASLLLGCGYSNSSGEGSGGSSNSSSTSGGGGSSASGGSSSSKSSSSGGSSASGGSSSQAGSSAVGGSSNTGGKGGGGGGGGNGGKAGAGGGGAGGKAGAGGTASAGGGDTGGTTETGTTSDSGGKGGAGGTAGKGGTTGAAGTTGTGGAAGGGGVVTTGPVTVQLSQTRQTIEGFGLNDTWRPLSDAEAKAMFDVSTGIGLTILRVGMSSSGGFYDASKNPASIASAKKYGATKIIGSTWSPPANCKDNNSLSKGGHLLEKCHGSWSDTITKFAKDNGLYAMSAGNEADFASCASHGPPCTVDYDTTVYTAKEMVAFVKVLGPKLKAAGVKLIAPEASEWIHVWSNASATGSTVDGHPESSDPLKCGCYSNTPTTTGCDPKCLNGDGYDYGHWLYKDKEAWGAFDILGVHQYDSQIATPWPDDVNGGVPDKPIWQTEMSGVKHWPEGVPNKEIGNGVAVAGWIHNALTVGQANAWTWWWYQGDNNEGLYLNDGSDTKRHYTFGNFSKFVRPGYVRVEVGGSIPSDVLLSAYKGTEGTVVVVAINKGTAEAKVPITIDGGTPASCTPNVTSASDNLKAGTAVSVSDGTFTATLGSKTVTTFVCK